MTNQEILNLKFKSNDLDKTITIRDYFKAMLTVLWDKEENFSGKRPFGNSGWQEEVYGCFRKNKLIGNYYELAQQLIREL